MTSQQGILDSSGYGVTITQEMIEAGAQRLVAWEDGSVWPDSWDSMTVAAARNDAERVIRSALSAAGQNPKDAVTVTMLPVAKRKADFIGQPMGVIVRNDAGALAAVTDLGRVTWLDDCVAGPVDHIADANKMVEQNARAQGAEPVAEYTFYLDSGIRFFPLNAFDDLPKGTGYLYTQPQSAESESYPDCDTCGAPMDYMPWHYATETDRHLHACNDCWPKVNPAQPQSAQQDPDIENIQQRDRWEEKATELAVYVGEFFDIDVGEHNSANCLVENAIKCFEEGAEVPETEIVIGTPEGWRELSRCVRSLIRQKDLSDSDTVSVGLWKQDPDKPQFHAHFEFSVSDFAAITPQPADDPWESLPGNANNHRCLVYTPSEQTEVEYRIVPAGFVKTVSDATHYIPLKPPTGLKRPQPPREQGGE